MSNTTKTVQEHEDQEHEDQEHEDQEHEDQDYEDQDQDQDYEDQDYEEYTVYSSKPASQINLQKQQDNSNFKIGKTVIASRPARQFNNIQDQKDSSSFKTTRKISMSNTTYAVQEHQDQYQEYEENIEIQKEINQQLETLKWCILEILEKNLSSFCSMEKFWITEYIKIFGGPFFDEYSQNEYNTYGSKFVKNVFDEYKSKCVQHIKPASRTKIYD